MNLFMFEVELLDCWGDDCTPQFTIFKEILILFDVYCWIINLWVYQQILTGCANLEVNKYDQIPVGLGRDRRVYVLCSVNFIVALTKVCKTVFKSDECLIFIIFMYFHASLL